MSLETTEAECAANAVAPRVSLEDIHNAISSEYSFVASNAVKGCPGADHPSLSILTIVLIVMKNGFVVVGKSAPASPENFNELLGIKLAREDAYRQIWPLMGFALRDKLAKSE